jgi:AcrR family transcriptional regulator
MEPPDCRTEVGVAERREREREELRQQIVTAARDLLLEQGLSGLSMRAIAERIEYSPAAIYLYFRDKDELVGEVVRTGFGLMEALADEEITEIGASAGAAQQYRALGWAYARFALENPAYFRIMFELPAGAGACDPEPTAAPESGFERVVETVRRGMANGEMRSGDARRTAVIGWGLVHGLTSLYLGGHLSDEVAGPDEFQALIGEAMETTYRGWRPEKSGGEAL